MSEPSRRICADCGVERPVPPGPDIRCPVCSDDRQLGEGARSRWMEHGEVVATHRNRIVAEEPGVLSLRTEPEFGIGQRAFLVQGDVGNVLWDCLSVLDEATVEEIRAVGGIRWIALSHPHFYGSVRRWSETFSNAAVYVHALDRQWAGPDGAAFTFWEGERRELAPGLTLVHCGGHFPGSAVLHVGGGERHGALFTADTIHVCSDRRSVSFMHSYPNYVPLGEDAVAEICERVGHLRFSRIYGAFGTIADDGEAAVMRSAARYVAFVRGQRR